MPLASLPKSMELTEEDLRVLGLTKEDLPALDNPGANGVTLGGGADEVTDANGNTREVIRPSLTIPQAVGMLPANYVETPWFRTLKLAAIPDEAGAIVFGPRGSGKTTAVRALASLHGATLITQQCFANMQEEDLIGGYEAMKGSTKFVDGGVTETLRLLHSGVKAWFVGEEGNMAHPGVWSRMNNLLDGSGAGLRLKTGEVIPPHPDFRFFFLYNEGAQYHGSREVNAALKDRLMPVYATYPPYEQELQILSQMTANTGVLPVRLKAVLNVAVSLRQKELRMDLSVRPLARWIRAAMFGGMSWKEAFEAAVVDLAGSPEVAAAKRKVMLEIGLQHGIERW